MKAAVSADGRYLDVTLTGRSDLSRVWFPTWSQDNGQDDLRWYEAVKQTDGSWTCRVPLSNHGSTGTYFIHAYGNNKKNLVAHTTAYVEKLVQPEKPAMTAVLSADGRYLDVTLTGQRSEPGMVPHLERRERSGRPAVVRGGQAGRRQLDLPGALWPTTRTRGAISPRLRQ